MVSGLAYSNCAAFIERSWLGHRFRNRPPDSLEYQSGHCGRENRNELILEQRPVLLGLLLHLGPFRIGRECVPSLLASLLARKPGHVCKSTVFRRSDKGAHQHNAMEREELGCQDNDEAIP